MEPIYYDQLSDIEAMGTKERAMVRQARETFQELNPQPVWIEPVFEKGSFEPPDKQKEFGLQSIMMRLAVIGSAGISVVTVGLILFVMAAATDAQIAADTGNAFLEFIAGALPLTFFFLGFGAEAYAFSHGYAKGKESMQIEFSNGALIAVFSIMISAGLFRAFGIVDDPTALTGFSLLVYQVINGAVIVSTGIGFPALTYWGAKNLGVLDNQYEALFELRWNEFLDQEKLREGEFRQKRNQDWNDYQAALDEWYKELEKYWKKEYSDQVFGISRSRTPSPRKPKQGKQTDGKFSYTDAVREYLKSQGWLPSQVGTGGAEAGHIVTPAAVCDGVAATNPFVPEGSELDLAGRKQISVYLGRLRGEEDRARLNGIDWLAA